jgi:DNA-binding response OmpR family regulator
MSDVAARTSILIVEDHADTAEMLRRFLARAGFAAETAAGGREALEVLSDNRPVCVILDETMPDMTGLDLLRQLRARPEMKETPVFFYSATYDWRKQMEAEALGAKAWFVKGVSRLEDLLKQIVTHCA